VGSELDDVVGRLYACIVGVVAVSPKMWGTVTGRRFVGSGGPTVMMSLIKKEVRVADLVFLLVFKGIGLAEYQEFSFG
jgi:hypothetical protein